MKKDIIGGLFVREVPKNDQNAMAAVSRLLAAQGLTLDDHLDYTCAVFDEGGALVGTGSCFKNTLRCLAVDESRRGEGILNTVVTHLVRVQCARQNLRLFLYAKESSAHFFSGLGFFEIARVEGSMVFMENRRGAFTSWLNGLAAFRRPGRSGALVMNANPFTLGHQYLAETAAAACSTLHIFVVSEDASLVPFSVRKELIRRGTAHIPNAVLHDSGPYMISNATFPSYFLKSGPEIIDTHARLDAEIFTDIARALNITARFFGEEPFSQVTAAYNRIMQKRLPAAGIDCVILPRKDQNGAPISASAARECLKAGDLERFRFLVPASTYEYFVSPAAAPVIAGIRAAEDVKHY